MKQVPEVMFSIDDAQCSADEWGANCGPGALAAVMEMTLNQVRPHLGNFETKRYTNPRLMYAALKSLGVRWSKPEGLWPYRGLVRVQWEGPWTLPNVPRRKRYRHTHWIASYHRKNEVVYIFDINVGRWVTVGEWATEVVPWLLIQVEPLANGEWSMSHSLELQHHFDALV